MFLQVTLNNICCCFQVAFFVSSKNSSTMSITHFGLFWDMYLGYVFWTNRLTDISLQYVPLEPDIQYFRNHVIPKEVLTIPGLKHIFGNQLKDHPLLPSLNQKESERIKFIKILTNWQWYESTDVAFQHQQHMHHAPQRLPSLWHHLSWPCHVDSGCHQADSFELLLVGMPRIARASVSNNKLKTTARPESNTAYSFLKAESIISILEENNHPEQDYRSRYMFFLLGSAVVKREGFVANSGAHTIHHGGNTQHHIQNHFA